MYLPIMLNIAKLKIVVIGGGTVALEKIKKLVAYGGEVTVVSITLLPEILKMEHVRCIQDAYRPSYIENAGLVISATNHTAVNKEITEMCQQLGILCNVVDVPEMCDFIFPASLKRGALMIAASSSGKSPMLVQKIIRELEQHYDASWEEKIEQLGIIRQLLMDQGIPKQKRHKLLKVILNMDTYQLDKMIKALETRTNR